MLEVGAELSRLESFVQLAVEAGASAIADEGRRFAERVAEGRFYVACVGQFKRGKSTLLNALVGEPVLPVGVVPVTAIVTVLRHGPRRAARVRLYGGAWQSIDPVRLSAYVAEQENPANEKGVAAVEVFLPSPLLASGMCLVDTPGLGSVFTSNTAATSAFVPHVDAALVVVGADPPISADELRVVEAVAGQVRDLVFVMNKADRNSEKERAEAARFTERVLAERLRRPLGALYQVSAAERLAGAPPLRDWDFLVEALATIARRRGAELVRAAEDRGLRLLVGRLRHELEEARDALVRPLAESECRIEDLRRCAGEMERSLGDLHHLFQAEQERLVRNLVDRRKRFLAQGLREARVDLARRVHEEWERRPAGRRIFRRRVQDHARDVACLWIQRWLATEEPVMEETYRAAATRFVELADGFLARLARSGEPALASLPKSVSPEVGFRTKPRFHATELMRLTAASPLRRIFYGLATADRFRRAVEEEADAYLARLIATNATRVESDFKDRVLESRRRLEAEIRAILNGANASAERALERARELRSAGSVAVRHEVARLDDLRARLARWETAGSADSAVSEAR